MNFKKVIVLTGESKEHISLDAFKTLEELISHHNLKKMELKAQKFIDNLKAIDVEKTAIVKSCDYEAAALLRDEEWKLVLREANLSENYVYKTSKMEKELRAYLFIYNDAYLNRETKTFSFSPNNIGRIKDLNDKLKKEEERIRKFAHTLNLTLQKQVEEKQIDDYNMEQELSVFTSNEACNKRHNLEEGDPIWEDRGFSLFQDGIDESFYTDDWNELTGKNTAHPLSHLSFCYTMHCLVFHSGLSWEDIVDIENVWIELKVDYQFFVEHNN